MDLIQYINLEVERAKSDGRDTAAKKYAACRRPLEAFLGHGRDMALALTLTPEWQSRYTHFLLHDYPAAIGKESITQTTLERQLDSLRTIVRTAIAQGILPNIKIGDAASKERSTLAAVDRRADMRRLLAIVSGASGCNPTEVERAMHRRLAIALIMVTLAGIDLRSIASLRRDALAGNVIILPHMRCSVVLPEVIADFVNAHVAREGTYLFPILCEDDTPQMEEQKIATLRAEITSALSHQTLNCRQGFADPFMQWINLAQQLGTPAERLMDLIARRYDDKASASILDSSTIGQWVSEICAAMAADFRILRKCWFAVKCRSTSGQSLSQELLDDPAVSINSEHDFFAPRFTRKRERCGKIQIFNDPTVDKLLFVNTTPSSVRQLQRRIGLKGVFYGVKTDGDKEFFTIPRHEIERLRDFLNVNDEHRRILPADKSVIGTRVRIIGGIYKGFEGVITRIKVPSASHSAPAHLRSDSTSTQSATVPSRAASKSRPSTTEPLFVVGIQGLCLLATTSFSPTLLEAL